MLVSALLVSALLVSALAQAAPGQAHPAGADRGRAAALAGPLQATTAATASAVGKLTQRGCVESGAVAACDLYAMSATTSVLGTTVPIWGFSSTGDQGTATAPGPLLVVSQGVRVTITLHNALSENVALALPGQAATAFLAAAGDDLVGAAPGATRTYSFTANRPGTFVYEAGHTDDGTRQVAMGLAGALVVLPADGSAYGAQPGVPATSYDDDAVLVLSEIDPALNAHPDTFDMRNFAPRYRLINGKPYPATDPISTDQGHTVLLRYANVGAQTHAMSVLGGLQVEIAQDGHPMKYPTTLAAESIEPGQTLDTTVRMPTGPEARLAVYEAAQHLDNNGQSTADPQQVAFGGMLTFLDTNAPAPTTDAVGPVSSHVKAGPNPSDGRSDVTITADLSDSTTGGSAVTQAEFVIDDATSVGVGFGQPMSATFGSVDVAAATGTIPAVPANSAPCLPASGPAPVALSCLAAGKHTVFVRALDAAGNWGVVGSVILNLPKTGPQTVGGTLADSPTNGSVGVDVSATGDDSDAGGTITAAEYFLDTVGPDGSGRALTLNRIATVASEDVTLTAAQIHALAEGVHHVYVHSHDSLNLWGPPLDIPLIVDDTGPGVDAASVGPNPTNGIIGDRSNPTSLLVSAQITDRDAGGAIQSSLVAAEAFLDPRTATPAGGSGLQLIAVDGKMNSSTEAVYGLIPLSQVKVLANGDHQIYVRGKDAAGNWGPLYATRLVVDKVAPVLGALTATPNPTNGAATLTLSAPVTDTSLIATAEYWLGTTDPGVGKGSSVPVSVVNGAIVVTVPLAGIPNGPQQVNLRVKDLAGNWSKAVNRSVTVSRPSVIFATNFEPTDIAWNASTGIAFLAPAAALPNANEPGSTQGLQVSMPGGTGNVASYLTDTSPTAESEYHARFAFKPGTLTSGANANTVLTLFEARTATAAKIFTLQYRVSGGVPQIRTVLNGAANATWVPLTAASGQILQLDWLAGRTGALTLKVNGATKSTQTANTNALRVETALLGVTAGYTTNGAAGPIAGSAYFDSFVSARTNLP